jgi:hypothetical protein
MRASALTGVAAAMTALAVVLSGCGSDTKTATESSSKTETSKADKTTTTSKKPKVTKTSEAPTAGPNPTIATYISENNIQEIGIKMGDPTAPAVNLPIPPDWMPLSQQDGAPDWAYGMIVNTLPEYEADPPNVIAIMSKLVGNVDPDQIIALAPGELKNLPDYDGGDGEPSTLADYPAVVLGGTYTRDGATRFIAQKTVLIPAPDGQYVLQLNVDGPEEARDTLNAVTESIDNETTIG